MLPDLIPGKSSGGKHLKLLLEVHPGDIKIIPKVLGLHLTTFTLKGFSTQRAREACRVVNVGQNWRLDCNKSRHSEAVLVPGRSIETVSFCGWAPCHAEDALCENTSLKMPSKLISNVIILQGKPIDSCICHQNGMETISVNIPFLDLAGYLPG